MEEQRYRRGGAAPAEKVDESQIRNIIDKLKANCTYAGLMQMLSTLLKLQVKGCTVDGQSAFKTWLKLAKDSHRSLAEGTDAAAVLLGLLEDVDGTLERVQNKTPLNSKMRKEQEAVRKIVPQARRALSCTACLPTTTRACAALLTPLHAARRCGSCLKMPASSWSTGNSPRRSPATRPSPYCTPSWSGASPTASSIWRHCSLTARAPPPPCPPLPIHASTPAPRVRQHHCDPVPTSGT